MIYFFFRGDFLTEVRVSPFVPGAICARNFNRGDFFAPSSLGPSVPETYDFTRKQLLLWRSYLPTSCCFPLFLFFFFCFCLYIYLFNLSFFACMSVLLEGVTCSNFLVLVRILHAKF